MFTARDNVFVLGFGNTSDNSTNENVLDLLTNRGLKPVGRHLLQQNLKINLYKSVQFQ